MLVIRRRRSLQAKATYSFDATTQQRLDGFSPNKVFAVLVVVVVVVVGTSKLY